MGVYIKGMDEMLEDNDILVVRNGDDCNPYIKYIGTLGYSMELVEVKEPHGKLIDADDFEERVRIAGGFSREEMTEDFEAGILTVLAMLKTQQTVIEAEGGD